MSTSALYRTMSRDAHTTAIAFQVFLCLYVPSASLALSPPQRTAPARGALAECEAPSCAVYTHSFTSSSQQLSRQLLPSSSLRKLRLRRATVCPRTGRVRAGTQIRNVRCQGRCSSPPCCVPILSHANNTYMISAHGRIFWTVGKSQRVTFRRGRIDSRQIFDRNAETGPYDFISWFV